MLKKQYHILHSPLSATKIQTKHILHTTKFTKVKFGL